MPPRRSHLVCVLAAFVSAAAPASAQTPDPATAPAQSSPRRVGFMTNYTFHLNAAKLSVDDARFSWDTHLGGDIDLFDYGTGRINFLANYEAILGEELREFDPNQGIYTLDLRASLRSTDNEVAAVFHHVSRHLSDRPRPFPIDWNMLGLEYWQRHRLPRMNVDWQARFLATLTRSYVDYRTQLDARAGAEIPVSPQLSLIGGGGLTLIGVDAETFERDAQRGGRIEGGLQIKGGEGVLELFVAYERRIDALPVENAPRTWTMVGFRLLNR